MWASEGECCRPHPEKTQTTRTTAPSGAQQRTGTWQIRDPREGRPEGQGKPIRRDQKTGQGPSGARSLSLSERSRFAGQQAGLVLGVGAREPCEMKHVLDLPHTSYEQDQKAADCPQRTQLVPEAAQAASQEHREARDPAT